jgi:predicted outer membrane repeat protein
MITPLLAFVAAYTAGLTPSAVAQTIFVKASAPACGNGATWNTAYRYLQDALTHASLVGGSWQILVAQGTYHPDDDDGAVGAGASCDGGLYIAGDRTASLVLVQNVIILGGWQGTGSPGARNPAVYTTILSGDLNDNDGPSFANNGENSYHVVTADSTQLDQVNDRLDGFTIRGGNADHATNNTHRRGAGVWVNAGSPRISNCVITLNTAAQAGGGIMTFSSPLLVNCRITANAAPRGAGLHINKTNVHLVNCQFIGNAATQDGGAVTSEALTAVFNNNVLRFTNCLFADNTAADQGGAIFVSQALQAVITNCSLTGNTAAQGGGTSRLVRFHLGFPRPGRGC